MVTPSTNADYLKKIKNATAWLDSKFKIPGTNISFGLDPIIGLIPVVGDIIGLVISSGVFASMLRHGVSGKVKILMLLNILLDTVVGSIPILGSVFDFYFKANRRNLILLQEHFQEGKHQGSGIGIIILVFLLLMALLSGVVYLIYRFFAWVF